MLDITEADLSHALFTTGRAPGDQFNSSLASLYEYIHRVSVVPAYLRRDPQGRIVRSRLAMDLDRSEKVALSYTVGQAATAIFSRQVVDVPFLLHVDRYARRFSVQFGSTRKRPDLMGLTWAREWIVAEAKGRSRAVPNAVLNDLEAQKRAVSTIGRRRPVLSFGCAAGFPYDRQSRRGQLRVDAIDPEEAYPDAAAWDAVTLDKYVQAYYEPFLLLLANGTVEYRGHYATVDLGDAGGTVGLLRPLARTVRDAQELRRPGLFARVKAITADLGPERYLEDPFQVFADGSAQVQECGRRGGHGGLYGAGWCAGRSVRVDPPALRRRGDRLVRAGWLAPRGGQHSHPRASRPRGERPRQPLARVGIPARRKTVGDRDG